MASDLRALEHAKDMIMQCAGCARSRAVLSPSVLETYFPGVYREYRFVAAMPVGYRELAARWRP